MGYATQTDLEFAAGGAAALVQATDWDNLGAIDTAKLDQALAAADGEINSYLKKFFEVPLAVPPPEITAISARIAIYKLLAGRRMLSENMIKEHDADVLWLKSIASGEATLGVQPQPLPSSMRTDSATPRPSWKDVSRAKLNGFR